MSEARKNFRHRFAGELARRGSNKIDIRVREQKADQRFAGVTRSANYCDSRFGRCHNGQCVFRLAPIAIGIVATAFFRPVS